MTLRVPSLKLRVVAQVVQDAGESELYAAAAQRLQRLRERLDMLELLPDPNSPLPPAQGPLPPDEEEHAAF